MANNKNVYQQKENVSIPKKQLLEISQYDHLDEEDLRVLLVLFTELNGYNYQRQVKDPENFKLIQPKAIAEALDFKPKAVKKSISHLIDAGIIEKGDSETVRGGYRFTF